jgi:uncharacterized protein (DUF2147 family)
MAHASNTDGSPPLRFLFAALLGLAGLVGAMAGQVHAQAPVQAPRGSAAAAPISPPATAPTAPAPSDVTGVWIDHTKRGAVEIMPCGNRLCGYIYWVKDLVSRDGKPVVDANNPDPTRRGKPICGTQILVNLSQQGRAQIGHVWGAGSIYNPDEGAKFDVELKLLSPNELSVLGYLGIKMLGEQFTWTRAPAELARCGPARV